MDSGTEILLKSLRIFCPDLEDQEASFFASKITFRAFKKRELFLRAGEVQKQLGFIVKGLVRSSYIDFSGNEITIGFYAEGDYATHYAAFLTRRPSQYSIQCLEPTTMACLSFADLQDIYRQSPVFERYGRLVAEEILKRQQARIEGFIFRTAEQRYLDFISAYPTLFNRISLSHLCTFLGIERQTLTRIRQKLAHQ